MESLVRTWLEAPTAAGPVRSAFLPGHLSDGVDLQVRPDDRPFEAGVIRFEFG